MIYRRIMQALCQGRVDLKRNSSCRNIYLYNVLCISQLVQAHIVCLFLPLLGKMIFFKKSFFFHVMYLHHLMLNHHDHLFHLLLLVKEIEILTRRNQQLTKPNSFSNWFYMWVNQKPHCSFKVEKEFPASNNVRLLWQNQNWPSSMIKTLWIHFPHFRNFWNYWLDGKCP